MGMYWPEPALQIAELEARWATDPHARAIKRDYSAEDVVKLRGSLKIEYTLAKAGAERLRDLLETQPYVATFGAMTGAQAGSDGQSGTSEHLHERLAGSRRCQRSRPNLS